MKTHKKHIKILMYIGSFVLVSCYCFILLNSGNPNVCREYKMYYITKEINDWPGYNGLDYKFNTKLMFSNNSKNIAKCKGEGWNSTEDSGTWTKENAILYFNLIDDFNENIVLNIGISDFMPGVEVSLNVNGKQVGTIKPVKNIKEYNFVIPKEISKQKFLKVSFDVKNAMRPSDLKQNADGRMLGVYVTSVGLNRERNKDVVK